MMGPVIWGPGIVGPFKGASPSKEAVFVYTVKSEAVDGKDEGESGRPVTPDSLY
jgi:hypothetical protein